MQTFFIGRFHFLAEFFIIDGAENIADSKVVFVGSDEDMLRLLLGVVVVIENGDGGIGRVALLIAFVRRFAADEL